MNQLKGDDESSRAPSIDAEGGAGPILPDRAFGLTALSNAAVSTTASGLLAYTAGCLAVLYDPELNTQTRLFKTEFAISSIATTIDGRFIALGCRNSDAFIKIFDIHSGNEVVTLKGHNYGVGCMAFSQDGKVLVSCGYKLDKQLYLWNWSKRQGVSAKIGNKVNSVCFHPQGGYFVTCGDRHLKWWFFSRSESSGEVSELKGHPASILEAQRYSHFTDCCFGMGAARHTLYCCTATGLLCTFLENRIMDKALQLNCSSANSVSVFASQLLIGCSDGACFVYNISDLSLIGTFPYPDALPMSAVQYAAAQPPSPSSLSFAACYAVRSIPNSRLVAIVYADRSMIIWDVVDFNKIAKHRFFPNHRACIWDIHFLLNGAGGGEGGLEGFGGSSDEVNTSPFPSSTFVTCSADSSIRFWTLDPKGSRQSAWRIPFSKDALRIIDTGADDAEFALEQHVYFDVRRDSPDLEHPHRVQHATSPRSLAVHPNRKEIVSGHRSGHINVYSLYAKASASGKPSNNPDLRILAHESEVLSLSFSPPYTTSGALSAASPTRRSMETTDKSTVLLASGGRDGLIHVFDGSSSVGTKKDRYSLVSTLPVHSSAVSIVKFTPDGRKLISCGMSDRTMVFSSVTVDDESKAVAKLKSVPTPEGTINGLAIDATNKYVITSGLGKRLNIWAISSGRQARSYHLENAVGELFRSDIDPSGMFIATCSLDRKIRIFDFFSGDVIAEIMGHSDAITGIKFSPDGRYIVSVGGDGCIIVWRVPASLVSAMQDRLLEMYTTAQRKLRAAREAATKSGNDAQLSLPTSEAVGNSTKSTSTKVSSLSSLVDSEPPATGRIKRPTPDALPAPPVSVARVATPTDVPSIPKPTSSSPPRPKAVAPVEVVPPSIPAPYIPPAPAVSSISSSDSISVSQSQSRWASRLKEGDADGYELFGRKINPSNREGEGAKLRNKFTLQLSPEATIEISSTDLPMSPGERISAERYEVNDDVVISPSRSGLKADEASDTEIPDSNLKDLASPIIEKPQEGVEGEYLNMAAASKKTDNPLSSAAQLGNWLDNQLVDDGDLKSAKKSSGKNLLSSSLSGAYFADLKAGKISAPEEPPSPTLDTSADDVDVDLYDDPPSPTRNQSVGDTPSRLRSARGGAEMEMQRKRTADAVSQMRDRLSAMGILEKGKGGVVDSGNSTISKSSPNRGSTKGVSESQSSLADSVSSPSQKAVASHKDPSDKDKSPTTKQTRATDPSSKDAEDDDDTASTVSATRDVDGFDVPDDLGVDLEEVEERTHQCALAMQQLEKAAAEAAAAMDSLQSLRESLVRRSVAIKPRVASSVAARNSAGRSSSSDFPAPGVSSSPSKRSSELARAAPSEGDAMLQMVDASLARMKERYSSLAASVSQSSLFDRF